MRHTILIDNRECKENNGLPRRYFPYTCEHVNLLLKRLSNKETKEN